MWAMCLWAQPRLVLPPEGALRLGLLPEPGSRCALPADDRRFPGGRPPRGCVSDPGGQCRSSPRPTCTVFRVSVFVGAPTHLLVLGRVHGPPSPQAPQSQTWPEPSSLLEDEVTGQQVPRPLPGRKRTINRRGVGLLPSAPGAGPAHVHASWSGPDWTILRPSSAVLASALWTGPRSKPQATEEHRGSQQRGPAVRFEPCLCRSVSL